MLLDPMGGIIITNDGNAILREIDVAHPAAKSMLELARSQDEEVRRRACLPPPPLWPARRTFALLAALAHGAAACRLSPCPALPCPALPCPALPCPALPCPALPCALPPPLPPLPPRSATARRP